MKTTIDYSRLTGPAKAEKALADIKAYLAERYTKVTDILRPITNPEHFSIACDFTGIHGYPVQALFDHFNGPLAWDQAWDVIEAQLATQEKGDA